MQKTGLPGRKKLAVADRHATRTQIDAHPLHYAAAANAALLAPAEAAYLAAHTSLLHAHYAHSFLAEFPPALRRMDDTGAGAGGAAGMVEAPDADAAVFVRVIGAGDGVLEGEVGEVAVEGTDVRVMLRRGDVWCLRWECGQGYGVARRL